MSCNTRTRAGGSNPSRKRNLNATPAGLGAARVFCFQVRMKLDFSKLDGLLPVVVQDASDGRVLSDALLARLRDHAWDKNWYEGF